MHLRFFLASGASLLLLLLLVQGGPQFRIEVSSERA
jgi:hypothetical protein